ncbi:hypothetical protein HZA38_04255, partial [Candidatus Peregrinibacteria bacterium]|nr:hypothetical protein [Candidatus Peregrinibacteria bacterium]
MKRHLSLFLTILLISNPLLGSAPPVMASESVDIGGTSSGEGEVSTGENSGGVDQGAAAVSTDKTDAGLSTGTEQIPDTETFQEEDPNAPIDPEKEAEEADKDAAATEDDVIIETPPPDPEPIPTPAAPVQENPLAFLKGLLGNYSTDLFTGAATYQYPLWIPKGRSSLMPSLTLQYSSSDRNFLSELGFGWRLPANAIYRSTAKGINELYTQNDFSSDIFGSQSELISVNFATGEYAAKTEGGFQKYIFANNTWTVTDNQGTIFTFGATPENRLTDPADSTRVYKWMLQKVQDIQGNTMTFTYFEEAGLAYPNTIRYTGSSVPNDLGIYEIKFLRVQRSYIPTSYVTGFRAEGKHFISGIEVSSYASGSRELIRTYDFSHDEGDSIKGKLTGITVRGGSGNLSYPPTRFFYYDGMEQVEGKRIDLMKRIEYPAGGSQEMTYKPSTSYRTPAQEGTNPNLPFIIDTVHTSTVKASIAAPSYTNTYDYEGGHYFFDPLDAYKKEYAGFHSVTITDPS